MKRSLERDDLAAPGRGLAELERGIDGICPRRTTELDLHPVPHRFRQERQLEVDELVLEGRREVEPVDEDAQLALDRLDHFWMIVSEREHAGTGEEVDEHVAVDILDVRALCTGDADRQPARIGAGVRFSLRLPVEQMA